jgi:Glycosyltransferase family 87
VTWPAFVTIAACVAVPGGLLSSGWRGDVLYYSHVGSRVVHGEVPYHDFYLEYPPGALPVFALPSLVSQHHYFLTFKLLMTLCAAAAAVSGMVVLLRTGADRTALLRAGTILGLGPLLLGPIFLNRYDVWPAALLSLALLALVAERPRVAFGLLAVATVAKIYPVAALPLAAVHVLRQRGAAELWRALAVFAAVGLAFAVPFAAVGFGGLGYSFYIQATRHLQVESLGSQLLVLLDHLGLYRARVVIGKPGSFDLAGRTADAVGIVSSVVEVAAVLLVATWYRRGRVDPQRLVLALATAVVAFVAFGKVLSPQYLVWLIPLVPLVDLAAGAVAAGMLVAALAMTQLGFYDSDGVANLTAISWLVLARDLLLVALFGLLARSLTRDAAA